MSPLVSVINVEKIYTRGGEAVTVLRDVSLSVAPGEFVALMGPSGSGKSTLLNLIAGLDRATRGEVRIGDTNLSEVSASQMSKWRSSSVGFVFQFYNLLPTMTAMENVELPLLLTNLPAKERARRAATALGLVGLEDRARHKPAELSGGQQQRVCIARAIVSDPLLLICDEPTGDLDRAASHAIMTLLSELNREYGKTLVLVTHDQRVAERASRTLVLDKGRLLADEMDDRSVAAHAVGIR